MSLLLVLRHITADVPRINLRDHPVLDPVTMRVVRPTVRRDLTGAIRRGLLPR